MRKNNRLLGLFVAGVLVCGAAVAGTVNAPVIIPPCKTAVRRQWC